MFNGHTNRASLIHCLDIRTRLIFRYLNMRSTGRSVPFNPELSAVTAISPTDNPPDRQLQTERKTDRRNNHVSDFRISSAYVRSFCRSYHRSRFHRGRASGPEPDG